MMLEYNSLLATRENLEKITFIIRDGSAGLSR